MARKTKNEQVIDILTSVLQTAAEATLGCSPSASGAKDILAEGAEQMAWRVAGGPHTLFAERRSIHEIPLAKGVKIRWESWYYRRSTRVKVHVLCDLKSGKPAEIARTVHEQLSELPVKNLSVAR